MTLPFAFFEITDVFFSISSTVMAFQSKVCDGITEPRNGRQRFFCQKQDRRLSSSSGNEGLPHDGHAWCRRVHCGYYATRIVFILFRTGVLTDDRQMPIYPYEITSSRLLCRSFPQVKELDIFDALRSSRFPSCRTPKPRCGNRFIQAMFLLAHRPFDSCLPLFPIC